jgi:linoleoyl-CoA desaturase
MSAQVMYHPDRAALRSPAAAPPAARIHFDPISANGFFVALKAKVDAYLKDKHHDGGLFVAGKAAFYLALAVALYLLALFGDFSGTATLALAVGAGVATILMAINAGHDGAHNIVSRHRWLNKAVLNISFTLVGVDPDLWQLRHAKSHHIFPNVNGCDIDIDSNMFLRLSPNHPRRWYQRWQHIYAPLLYAIVGFHSAFIQDFQYLFKTELANLKNITHKPSSYVAFFARKIVYAALVFVVPLMLLPFAWWQVVLGALLMNAVASFVFVSMLIGTHFAEEVSFPHPDENGALGRDFAIHALETSLDWLPQSRLAQFISGGANAHAAHHLFPHVSHAHYVPISKMIEETALEFGVRYNRTTFFGLVSSHFRFLKRMGTG